MSADAATQMEEAVEMLRGLLLNATERHIVTSRAAHEAPSAEYLQGVQDGADAERIATLALAIAVLSGGSATEILTAVTAEAAMSLAFPVTVIPVFVEDTAA